MKKAKKILYCGSHGTGKSTAALTKAAELKLGDRKLSVKIIEENVRELVSQYGLQLNTAEFQKLCFVDHLKKEYTAEIVYDYVVCDRTCFDTLVYGLVYGLKLPPELLSFALDHLSTFDQIYFYRPMDTTVPITNDGFRDTDIEMRNKVDEQFERLLKMWGGKYTEVRN